jgi:hypothetical protein
VNRNRRRVRRMRRKYPTCQVVAAGSASLGLFSPFGPDEKKRPGLCPASACACTSGTTLLPDRARPSESRGDAAVRFAGAGFSRRDQWPGRGGIAFHAGTSSLRPPQRAPPGPPAGTAVTGRTTALESRQLSAKVRVRPSRRGKDASGKVSGTIETPIRKPFLLKKATWQPIVARLGMRDGGRRFVRWLPPRPPRHKGRGDRTWSSRPPSLRAVPAPQSSRPPQRGLTATDRTAAAGRGGPAPTSACDPHPETRGQRPESWPGEMPRMKTSSTLGATGPTLFGLLGGPRR